jgi:hypothetical protein
MSGLKPGPISEASATAKAKTKSKNKYEEQKQILRFWLRQNDER